MIIPSVHILATVRNKDLLPYTLLVFKSINTGFPTAPIFVYGNDLDPNDEKAVKSACDLVGASFKNIEATIHHKWIEERIATKDQPFWICDTDMIFYSSVEDWNFNTALAGFLVPEFDDEFTGAITRSRLHTSLLYIDPLKVKEQVNAYESRFPSTPFNPKANLIHPLCLTLNGRGYFHDTCSLLYHAIGGTAFRPQQKDAYFHFNFGTLSDLVLPRLRNGKQIHVSRDIILKNQELGKGIWREQEEFYADRKPNYDGVDVIAKIDESDAKEGAKWNEELCRGDAEAKAFCNLWYGYVHGADDLADSLRDGRPTMSKRQMMSLFFTAAVLYNTSFYKKNSELLFPMVLDITNQYVTSLEWENSPLPHRRQMADLMRMSANRMYSMVALIVGGEEWMQEINQRLFDRDWVLQHNKDGYPI